MKSCLGSLALVVTVAALVITAIYHTSVNSELRFETRDSHVEYINTHRSYRPPIQKDPTKQPKKLNLPDDEQAEEVAP